MTTGRGGQVDPTVHSEAELLRRAGAKDRDELGVIVDEEAEYDAWVEFDPTGVEVRMGRKGIMLEYPFRLDELWEVIADLEADFENDIERSD